MAFKEWRTAKEIYESIQINALADLIEQAEGQKNNDIPTPEEMATYLIEHNVTILPCRIGDKVWAIRKYNGVPHAREGIVGDMSYTNDMRLSISVRGVARGLWGEKVFATQEDCERAIKEKGSNENIQ